MKITKLGTCDFYNIISKWKHLDSSRIL